MKTFISLENVRFYSHHGVFEQEKCIGNWFEVSVKLKYDFTPAMTTDRLEGTLNYAKVYSLIKAEMEIPSKLMEHVAGRIINSLNKNFPQIESGYLKISKMNPPINAAMHCAAVEVEW